MVVEQLVVVLPLLIPVPVAIYLLAYLARRRGPFDASLAIIIAAGGFWCGGYTLEVLVEGYSAKLWVVKFEYIAFVLGPIGWLLLGLQMQDKLAWLGRKGILLLFVVPVLTLLQVFTVEHHAFFWLTKELVEFNGLYVFQSTYGPGFWLHIGYSYTLNLIGAVLIVAAMFESGQYYVRQRIALAVALVLPWVANILYVSRIGPGPLDLTPFTIVVSGLIMVMGVFRFGFGDLIPVARAKVIAGMQDGVMILDNQMRVVDCNQAAQTLFGFESSCVGRDAEELLVNHPKLLRLLERQQQNTDLIYSGIGERVHRISSELLADNSSRLLMIRDLSADSRIQDALRLVVERTSQDVGEDFFRSLTRSLALALDYRYAMVGVISDDDDQLVEGLAFWDTDSHRENFNYELAGSPCERVVDAGACVYPQNVVEVFPQDQSLKEFNVDGYLGTPLLNHAGDVVGLLIVMDDRPLDHVEFATTLLEIMASRAAGELERRANERELIESQQSYRRIVEATEDGVCVTDGQGFIQFVNEPMSDFVGDGEILGKKLWALLDIGDADGDTDGNRVECRIVNPAGREYWMHISKTMIEDESEARSGILYLFSDVTDAKSLAEANERIQQQLQHAQKMESLGVLAGGVAHDFNNLLMPILGYLDLIKQRATGDNVISDYVQRVQHAGGKLAELCNQMLTYSGKGHFIESDIDVNDQIEDLQQLMRASVPRKFSLEYDLESDLPNVWADATQMSQVIMNLLINAGEAMSIKQEGKIIISTGSEFIGPEALGSLRYGDQPNFGHYIYIDVADEGVGLNEEDANRLFEPFYTTKFTGRGLGMAVVYGIMRAHGGAIRIVSTEGTGTGIRVLFPVSTDSPTVREPDAGEAVLSRQISSGKVLVVDDEDYVRELVRNMLESIGFEVIEAKDGSEGLAAFSSFHDDLEVCIIDVTMPGMGGLELVRRIREQDTALPVLLVSGYSHEEVRDGVTKNVSFLQKPFTIDQIRSAIEATGEQKIH